MKTQMLPVPLTTEETIARAREAARLVDEIESKEESKRLAAKAAADEIGRMRARLAAIAREVQTGQQMVEVEVRTDRDIARRVDEVVRCDTGEIIASRQLAPHECQLGLLDGDEPCDE